METDFASISKNPEDLIIGIDIGSISINSVILDKEKNVLHENYTYCHGRPFEQLKLILDELLSSLGNPEKVNLAFTGSGGKLASQILGGAYVNEVISQSEAVAELHPEVKTQNIIGLRT